MRMKYQVVLEFDSDTRHYTGTVVGIPSIVVDAKTERTALRLAKEAIAWRLETAPDEKVATNESATVHAKLVTVDVGD